MTEEDIRRQEALRLVESAKAQMRCECMRPESWETHAASLAGLHSPEEVFRPGLLRPRQLRVGSISLSGFESQSVTFWLLEFWQVMQLS